MTRRLAERDVAQRHGDVLHLATGGVAGEVDRADGEHVRPRREQPCRSTFPFHETLSFALCERLRMTRLPSTYTSTCASSLSL